MDNTSFNQIYTEYVSMVYNLCLSYFQNIEEAEEVTQDVFVKVYQKFDSFKGNSTLKTWIYRITINNCLDFIKAKKRVKRFGFFTTLFTENQNERKGLINFNHPGVLLEDKEALEILFNQINELPEKQKTALILKSVEGMSQKEIAEVMNASEKSIESLLSRSRSNLKKKRN
jgi:RNA polymerase sigma-70 factor (ECF subfamily)